MFLYPEKRIKQIGRRTETTDMLKGQIQRYTEAVRHHTEAVYHPGKLLLCGGTNQLNGELNQRYDVKFLLTGD